MDDNGLYRAERRAGVKTAQVIVVDGVAGDVGVGRFRLVDERIDRQKLAGRWVVLAV